MLIEGVAGTGKTHHALEECQEASTFTIIRNVEPVGKGLGYLPGDAREKMQPFFDMYDPILKKVFNYSSKYLMDKGRLEFMPTAFLRGKTLEGTIVVDEAQNLSYEELRTCLTRVGRYARIIFVGDVAQSDVRGRDDYYDFTNTFLKCKDVEHLVLTDNYRSNLLNDFIRNEGNLYV
jgi:predicted ribonuclease YlaK